MIRIYAWSVTHWEEAIERAFDKIADVAAIRQALIEGEGSGEPEPFDFGEFKQRKAVAQLVSRIDTRYVES